MPQCHYQCKSNAFQKFKNLEFSPFTWTFKVLLSDKWGENGHNNVAKCINQAMIYDWQNVTKEMQWYKLTNPSAPWICMIIISDWEKKRKKGKDFHRRRENCSSFMSRFLLLPLFSNLATAHLGKAIRAARLLFFHTASIWVSEEENQAWLVSLKKRSENGQKDDGSSVTIKAMNVVSERCLETTHIMKMHFCKNVCNLPP